MGRNTATPRANGYICQDTCNDVARHLGHGRWISVAGADIATMTGRYTRDLNLGAEIQVVWYGPERTSACVLTVMPGHLQ